MKIKSAYVKSTIIYLLGLFIMALGVSVSRISDLGVSPVNAVPCVLSYIVNIDMGICTTVVFCLFILIQILIMRKEFKIKNLLQIIGSFIFGFFVSASNFLCNLLVPACNNYIMQLVYIIISIVLVAFGIFLYLEADILSLPGEGVTQAVSYKSGIHLSTAKIIFDISNVAAATVISLVFLHSLQGVREGTIIAALGVGSVLKLVAKIFKKPVRRLLNKGE